MLRKKLPILRVKLKSIRGIDFGDAIFHELGYRAAMKLSRAIMVACLAMVVSMGSLTPSNAGSWQEQMLTSLNSIRADKGLKPLKMCKSLTKAAQQYATVMATGNYLAHEGKDGSTPGQRIQTAGYGWKSSSKSSGIAENIAGGQVSVTEVMKDWTKSTSHFKNMTGSKFVHVGFGMAENQKSSYKKYWVQNFGFGASC